jgi:hypothetical protein
MDRAFYIYIDSANRESGSIADFNFATTQNRYVSSRAKVGLESIQIPFATYNVTSANNELAFQCQVGQQSPVSYNISLDTGLQTVTEIVSDIRTKMNAATTANQGANVKVAVSYLSGKLKIAFKGDGNDLSYTLFVNSSTCRDLIGLTANLSFLNVNFTELQEMVNVRPFEYVYLVSPNIQSSSFASNIGGNGIVAKIPLSLGQKYSTYYEVNDNIMENLMDCSYIPFSWNFRLVDKSGRTIDQLQDYSFTLRVIPEE